MEKLLALKGIKKVSYLDINNITYVYFYSEKLLNKGVFIEQYESKREEDTDSDEEDKGIADYITSIVIFMEHADKSYEFTILYDTRPFVPKMYLYRIILDVVKIIEGINSNSIIEYLESAAEVTVSTDIYRNDAKLQRAFTERIRQQIERVSKLITETKVKGN